MQLSFNAKPCSVDDGLDDEIEHEDFQVEPTVVLNHKTAQKVRAAASVLESTAQDLNRIQTLHNRIAEMYRKRLPILPPRAPSPEYYIAGVLGLGRGKLSFSSQLQSLYGDYFSYCLVDRNSNMISELNFTSLLTGKEKPIDTFYYVEIKSVVVGGEVLNIPRETWIVSSDGLTGTIVDPGTMFTHFAYPAYKIIKEAFVKKVNDRYPVVKGFPIMDPCYNVSGVDEPELPSFGLIFGNGAVWEFPVENYFIRLEKENVVCLAILGTPRLSLSIIGNYQLQY